MIMSQSEHIDNKKKHMLIYKDGPTNGLNDTTVTAEKEYLINFTEQQNNVCSSLHYKCVNCCLFVNCVKIYKIKAKDPEINASSFCLDNVSKDISVFNM